MPFQIKKFPLLQDCQYCCPFVGTTTAVVTYFTEDEDYDDDPTSTARVCDVTSPCRALNCLPGSFRSSYHTVCVNVGELRAVYDERQLYTPAPGEDVDEYFVNMGYVIGASINGIQHVLPTGTPSPPSGLPFTPCAESCGRDESCACFNVLEVPFNRTIQLVVANYDAHEEAGLATQHNIHLHGFNFAVMKIGKLRILSI